VREPRPGERRLVVFTEAGADAAAAGRQWLAGLGIDADWQQLPSLPTDANGQVDRRTLTVDAAGAGSRPTRRDPVTPTEKTLAAIWAELLSVRQIDSADNFFSLGGTSLLAMQAAERMKAATGRSVHARRFVFESLAQLALAYDTEGAPSTAPESAPPPEQGSFLSRVASRWKKKG
jgi:hypothetical protein